MQGPFAAVIAAAFVFASASLVLAPGATAQDLDDGMLTGTVCYARDYGEPRPLPAYEGGGSDGSPGSMPAPACYDGLLPGANVRVTRAGTAGTPVLAVDESAETGDDGRFVVDGLPDGAFDVEVSRAGFETLRTEATIEGGKGELAAMLQTQEVEQAGQATDADGEPVAGAVVEVNLCCAYGYPDNLRRATTDAEGRFTITMTSGHQNFNVRADGFHPYSEYRLADGQEAVFALKPLPPPDAYIEGIVRDQDGRAVRDVNVVAVGYGSCCQAYDMPAGDAAMAPSYYGGEVFTTTDAEGRYRLGVYAGQGYLGFTKEGHAPRSQPLDVKAGEDQEIDVRMPKYPEPSVRLGGKVVDAQTGKAVPYASVSIRLPEFNLYECSRSPDMPVPMAESKVAAGIVAPDMYPYWNDCRITVGDDGAVSGTVRPGYAIVSVHQDHWRTCNTTTDADGAMRTACGPEYYSFVQTVTLPANGPYELVVRLRPKPGPDATMSGYLVDAASGKAVADGSLSFYHQDGQGWGQADVDGDGSYKVRLRGGLHTVSVCAQGYLPWEGLVDIASGDNAFDVKLRKADDGMEGCGWYGPVYAKGVAESDGMATGAAGGMAPPAFPQPSASGTPGSAAGNGRQQTDQAVQYEDLNGGLGPYDAAKRAQAQQAGDGADGKTASKGSPAPGLLLLAAALAGMVLLRRRK